MTENYPWYALVTGAELRQGDLLFDCPVIVPRVQPVTLELASLDADILTYDVIVMSQSCDLEQDKLDLVLVCPHWPLSAFAAKQEYFKSTKGSKLLMSRFSLRIIIHGALKNLLFNF